MPVYKYKTAHGDKWYVKANINGLQFCKRGFNTERQAIVYEAGLFNGTNRTSERFVVKDVIPLYEQELKRRVKITTFTQNKYVLKNHIYPFFKNMYTDKIDRPTLEMFYTTTINNPVYKDKNKIFTIARDFLSFLKDYNLSYNLNIKKLKAPYNSRKIKRKYNYYTREEFEQYMSKVYLKRYKLIFLLFFNYGLRFSELLGLKHSNIFDDKVIIEDTVSCKTGGGQKVVSTKNEESERVYPMLDCIREAYKEYIESDECVMSADHVFSNGTTITIGETPIRTMHNKIVKLAGVKYIKPHEFRHSCATELINKGFSPEQVAAWLGHKSSVTTLNTYFHLFPSKKMEIANYYNNLYKK